MRGGGAFSAAVAFAEAAAFAGLLRVAAAAVAAAG